MRSRFFPHFLTFRTGISTPVLAVALGLTVVAFVAIHLLLGVVLARLGPDAIPMSLAHQFNLNGEANIPTWFSSMVLVLCALQVIHIGLRAQRWRWHWLSIGFIVSLMSMDESAMLHEASIRPLRDFFQADGLLYFTWIIPGIVSVFAVLFFYFRFWRSLPDTLRWGMALAAAAYVTGAIGVEALSGRYFTDFAGQNSVLFSTPALLLTALEEGLEMTGIVTLFVTVSGAGSLQTLLK